MNILKEIIYPPLSIYEDFYKLLPGHMMQQSKVKLINIMGLTI